MVNTSLLREFIPITALPANEYFELAKKAKLGNYQKAQIVFSRGEKAGTVVYLIAGEVELLTEKGARTVKGGASEAKHPLSQGIRRGATATVLSKEAQVLFVDRQQLDMALTWSQTGAVEVNELDGGAEGGDWMSALLQNESFRKIHPANIARIFAAMQPLRFSAGQEIIRQGDDSDRYYVVAKGECAVLRRENESENHKEIARLGVGAAFGEEALISGNKRNATVQAVTPCELMGLSARDFAELLKPALLKEVDIDAIPDRAVLVDARLAEEFRRARLPDAINLPLHELRARTGALDPGGFYVVYCDTGQRSAVATYLLTERGFDAYVLKGGVPVEELPICG